MPAGFTPPPLTASLLGQLDPRWKLVSLTLLIIGMAWLRSLPALGLALAVSLLLVRLARLPWDWYRERLEALAWVVGLFVLPLPFLVHGDEIVRSPLAISLAGVVLGVGYALKAVAILNLVLVLLATAPVEATLKAAHALYVPGVLIQVVLLSYRYLFLLGDELARLRLAMRVRGFRHRTRWHTWRTYGRVTGTLLVRGQERADRVAQAMRCRGFTGRFHSLEEFRTTWKEGLLASLGLLVLVGLLGLDWWVTALGIADCGL
jgi:cobalt/nickel transport system permease protein